MPREKTLSGPLTIANLERIRDSKFKGNENAAVKNINEDIWKAIGTELIAQLSKLGDSPSGTVDLRGTISIHISGELGPPFTGGIEFKLP